MRDANSPACMCGLGVGTAPAPCPLHPQRHSPYGIEATATRADLAAAFARGTEAMREAIVETIMREDYGSPEALIRGIPAPTLADPMPARPFVIGAPGVPVIASREDAARVFGKGTDDYNLAVSALAYFETLLPPHVVKVKP